MIATRTAVVIEIIVKPTVGTAVRDDGIASSFNKQNKNYKSIWINFCGQELFSVVFRLDNLLQFIWIKMNEYFRYLFRDFNILFSPVHNVHY